MISPSELAGLVVIELINRAVATLEASMTLAAVVNQDREIRAVIVELGLICGDIGPAHRLLITHQPLPTVSANPEGDEVNEHALTKAVAALPG